MKRRLEKKWIKRYITPVIKDLPTTRFGATPGLKNYTIINGEITPEGCYARSFNRISLRKAIMKTGTTALEVLVSNYGTPVYLRVAPKTSGRNVRIRLIADQTGIIPQLEVLYA